MEKSEENFKITDEFFEEMQKNTPVPTPEEIETRPKIENDPFEFVKGDKDEKINAREDKPKNN